MTEVIHSGNTTKPQIALTFDDGPIAEKTDKVLAVLKKHNVKATFFLIGQNVENLPALAQQIQDAGHLLGNHTFSHIENKGSDGIEHGLVGLPEEQVREELDKTNKAVYAATGSTLKYFRPTYGEYDGQVIRLAKELGLTAIHWSIDPMDWDSDRVNSDSIVNTLRHEVRNGSIVLLHDHGNSTVQALDIAIPELKQKGFQFVTVDELLSTSSEPSQTYTVQPGDDLSKIAKKFYGDGSEPFWRKIYEANKALIGPDPNYIEVGWELIIPDVEEQSSGSNIQWAGVRSSPYGVDPNLPEPERSENFPKPEKWVQAMKTMSGYFPDSTPVTLWGIGEIDFDSPGTRHGMKVNFPKPVGNYDELIHFATEDKYESYLSAFDQSEIKVFLLVEPGHASMNDLIDATLKQYGHHPCVIGFGVDVEFYKSMYDGDDNTPPVTDDLAQAWESKVKSYSSSYQLLLKHYAKENLPKTYRGDIVFVDDSQGFDNLEKFVKEMADFAQYFYPNPVMYQIGYDDVKSDETHQSDKYWWSKLPKPIPQKMGEELSKQTKRDQDVGIIWVDFTLRDKEVDLL